MYHNQLCCVAFLTHNITCSSCQQLLSDIKMHGQHSVKFINAQQAKSLYNYRNIKEKLLKTNASISFNNNNNNNNNRTTFTKILVHPHYSQRQ